MPTNTPIYGLPHLLGSDGGKRIAEVSEALALKLEAILASTGNAPLDSDLLSVLQRLGEAENAIDDLLAEADTPWRPVALKGDWVNFGNPFRSAAYRIKDGDYEFRGAIKSGGTGTTKPILTVDNPPIGGDDQILLPANGGFADCRIDTAGRVYIAAYSGGGNNGVVSLNALHFSPAATQA